jgi:hypothetical protein
MGRKEGREKVKGGLVKGLKGKEERGDTWCESCRRNFKTRDPYLTMHVLKLPRGAERLCPGVSYGV